MFYILALVLIVFFLASAIKILREYERGVIFRLGRVIKTKGPGLIILIPVIGWAQSYRFFSYGVPEGLCDNFAYTINQDKQGFLWIGTTQGLCRFDGREFDQEFRGDSIPPSIALASLLDSRGRLWFGHENGQISVLEEDQFRLVDAGSGRLARYDTCF